MQIRFAHDDIKHEIKANDRNSPEEVFCVAYAEEECQKHLAPTLQVLPKIKCKTSKPENVRRIMHNTTAKVPIPFVCNKVASTNKEP